MAADAGGRPVRFILTGGQTGDASQAAPLLVGIKATHVIADKGYDTDGVLALVRAQGAVPVIPPTARRRVQRHYDRQLYKERNLIERAFNKLKCWRRIATRYDRRSLHFLAFLHLAAAVTWSA
jgi:transposase